MNKRFKELAEQATEYYSNGFERSFNKEKFTELIVRECIKESIEEIVSDDEIAQEKIL